MSKPKEIIMLPGADKEVKNKIKKRQKAYCDKYYDTWSDTCFKCPLNDLSNVTGHDCAKAYALYILR